MRFLIDANMPRSAAGLLKRYNHEAVDVRDTGMGAAADSDIAIYAQPLTACERDQQFRIDFVSSFIRGCEIEKRPACFCPFFEYGPIFRRSPDPALGLPRVGCTMRSRIDG
jgi:Domain of unknown function (DUF5615)